MANDANMAATLDVLRSAFMALARAESALWSDRTPSGRRRYDALLRSGERLSARIADIEDIVDRPEPVGLVSPLGLAQEWGVAPGDLPTVRQCDASAAPERRPRQPGITFGHPKGGFNGH